MPERRPKSTTTTPTWWTRTLREIHSDRHLNVGRRGIRRVPIEKHHLTEKRA
jgi:hypothetical protein